MPTGFDLRLPTRWASLTDAQLRHVFTLLSAGCSGEEVRIRCAVRWAGWRIVARDASDHTWLVQHRGRKFWVMTWQMVELARRLSFLDDVPELPVRLARIGRHRAVDATLDGVTFEEYLFLENLYQGFLQTHRSDLLCQMAQILYRGARRLSEAERTNVFYWWASLKAHFARLYPHFFRPAADAAGGNLLTDGAVPTPAALRDAMNAQIRALTGGDVTKEDAVRRLPLDRALTALDALAREAEEVRRTLNS